MAVYVVLVGVTVCLFKQVPGGFVPGQDKQYLVGFARLPDGATLDRTEEVIRRMSDIALTQPGVESSVGFPRPVDQRLHQLLQRRHRVLDAETVRRSARIPSLSGDAIAAELNKKYAGIQEAFIAMFPPPPVNGLGTIGGFKLQIEDRAGLGYEALNEATKAFIAGAAEGAGDRRPVLELSGQRAATLRRHRSHQGAAARRSRDGGVQHAADLSRLVLRQRLQQIWPHLLGLCAGRRAVPRPRRRHPAAEGALGLGRHGAAVGAAHDPPERGSRARDPLQRLPVLRHQRRCSAGLLIRPGAGGRDADRRGDAAARLRLRMDRPDLSGVHRRQFRPLGVPARDPAGVPGAGRALRKPDAAARRSS